MAISLYDASVGCFIQTVGAAEAFLERGLAHCIDNGIDPNEIVETRLFPDMFPFSFQVRSIAHHSIHAIEGAKSGTFGPPEFAPPMDYAALQKLVSDALQNLKALKPDEVNALEGNDVVFAMPGVQIPFKAEGFLLSFSLPNFHFHATTTYDILRSKGVPLGKRDYMGRMRINR